MPPSREALTTTPGSFFNLSLLVICLIRAGRLFHSTGPDFENALSPNVLNLVLGAIN